ncbi:hypothetical protein BHU61_13285 (plasmid) [Macrococcus epidermidis]|uniref:HTH merR-type domain-containing protein n=1 Tax=Macrococcus epidermidis TaxID=1902580 RepID=A0A327ZM38_9STAP|nr:MerR family transcriptional regulator [Macrococcus epidermidis]RAK43565.1 hypothetical protein BHU61_13285 [Macrococcus epidermidis]
MKDITQYYSPTEVSKKINLSASSVRRYSIALEDAGYNEIARNDKGHRRYTLHDLKTVQYLHTLVNDKKMPFNDAITKTIADQSYIVNDVDSDVIDDLNETSNDLNIKVLNDKIDLLAESLETVINQNRALLNAFETAKEENKRLLAELEKRPLTLDNKGVDGAQTVKDTEVVNGAESQEDKQITLDEITEIIVNKSNENNETKSDKDAVNSADHTSDVDAESQEEETPIKIMAVEDEIKDGRIEKMRKESEESNQKGIGKLFNRLLGRK